jgi:ABC-type phosphate/phosphonate transport system substrate-binding protein
MQLETKNLKPELVFCAIYYLSMKLRLLFLGSVIALVVSIVMIMLNHRHAVVSARAIIVKDQNSQSVTGDLVELKKFVESHMRTGVSLELAASYDRAVEAAKAAAAPKVDPAIYQQAQASCAKHKVATVQTKCVADFVASHGAATGTAPILPDRSRFSYTYKSPGWSPDAAGLTLLASVCGLVLTGWLALFRQLKR